MYASAAELIPVIKIPSKTPIPPMLIIFGEYESIFFRLSKSAPTRVPQTPAEYATAGSIMGLTFMIKDMEKVRKEEKKAGINCHDDTIPGITLEKVLDNIVINEKIIKNNNSALGFSFVITNKVINIGINAPPTFIAIIDLCKFTLIDGMGIPKM